MTEEAIRAIKDAQKERDRMREEQREALSLWEETHLKPLTAACDHQYPWGESAKRHEMSGSNPICQICGMGFWRG
jgi:hypothetical protein